MATPTLVQASSHQSCLGDTITQYKSYFDYAVLSGNTVLVYVNCGSASSTPTVTDDKSNTYTSEISLSDGSQVAYIFRCKNVTNGPRQILTNFSTSGTFVEVHQHEWKDLTTSAAAYGGVSNSGSGTAISTASITPSTAGDLILNFVVQDSGLPENAGGTTLFTPGGSFHMICPDLQDGQVVQYQIAPNTSAITPTMTQAPTNPWISVSIAIPGATAGTLPNATDVGIRIHQHMTIGNGQTGSSKIQSASTSEDKMLVVMWWGNPDHDITGITDTAGNTWVQAIHEPTHGNAGDASIWYVNQPIVSETNAITIAKNGVENVTGSTIHLLYIKRSADIPIDKTAVTSGTNTSTNTTVGATIDPAIPNELVLWVFIEATSTTTAASAGTAFMTTIVPQPATAYVDNNNGGAFARSTDGSPLQNTWTHDGPPDEWIEIGVAIFEAPGNAIWDQEGYQFRADDGSESGAHLLADPDTPITRTTLTNTRLRTLVNVTNNPLSKTFQLEVRKKGLVDWAKVR